MKKLIFLAMTAFLLAACRPPKIINPQVGSVHRDTINGVPCCVYLPNRAWKVENGIWKEPKREIFPVLYLQHGMWGDENDWPDKGLVPHIMDSLLKLGTIKEMVVIMPDNCPSRPTSTEEIANATDGHWEGNFAAFMEENERRYPISNQPSQRAIAGLSMGGYHTMMVSSTLDGQFDYIGMFSPATFVHKVASSRKLLWIGIGKDDFLYLPLQSYLRWLQEQHVEYVYYESAGGHEWPNWQDYLCRFLPKCFQ